MALKNAKCIQGTLLPLVGKSVILYSTYAARKIKNKRKKREYIPSLFRLSIRSSTGNLKHRMFLQETLSPLFLSLSHTHTLHWLHVEERGGT